MELSKDLNQNHSRSQCGRKEKCTGFTFTPSWLLEWSFAAFLLKHWRWINLSSKDSEVQKLLEQKGAEIICSWNTFWSVDAWIILCEWRLVLNLREKPAGPRMESNKQQKTGDDVNKSSQKKRKFRIKTHTLIRLISHFQSRSPVSESELHCLVWMMLLMYWTGR